MPYVWADSSARFTRAAGHFYAERGLVRLLTVAMGAPAAARRRSPAELQDPEEEEMTPEELLQAIGADSALMRDALEGAAAEDEEEEEIGEPSRWEERADAIKERYEEHPVSTVGIAAAAVCVAGLSVKLLLTLLGRLGRKVRGRGRSSDRSSEVTGCAHSVEQLVALLVGSVAPAQALPHRRAPDRFCSST